MSNFKGILDLVLDTLKREQHEAQERLKQFYEDKEQLTEKYREGKKIVENLKEQLQQKISEYSNLSKEGNKAPPSNIRGTYYQFCKSYYFPL